MPSAESIGRGTRVAALRSMLLTRVALIATALGSVLACGGAEDVTASEEIASAGYVAAPVIVRSGVYDANETSSCTFGGCVIAFMYFAAASGAKVDALPRTLDGLETYDVDAWASNFEGPNRVLRQSAHQQWEWSIDNTESGAPRYLGKGECSAVRAEGRPCFEAIRGAPTCGPSCTLFEHSNACECNEKLVLDNVAGGPAVATTWGRRKIAQVSTRVYPLVYAREVVRDPSRFTVASIVVKEDDEGFFNDTVGTFAIDRRRCQSDVFSKGLARGWTSETRYEGGDGDGDIAFVDYRLWCER
jgi:hypothetical protein